MVAKVRASDGRVLFCGCPPNISSTGLAFTTEHPVGAAPELRRNHPSHSEVGLLIDASGRLVWCETVEGLHLSGCQMLDLLADSRGRLTDVLRKAA